MSEKKAKNNAIAMVMNPLNIYSLEIVLSNSFLEVQAVQAKIFLYVVYQMTIRVAVSKRKNGGLTHRCPWVPTQRGGRLPFLTC